MTKERKELIDRFDRWLKTNPRKQIISAECANIAEEYANEQLLKYGIKHGKNGYNEWLTETPNSVKE